MFVAFVRDLPGGTSPLRPRALSYCGANGTIWRPPPPKKIVVFDLLRITPGVLTCRSKFLFVPFFRKVSVDSFDDVFCNFRPLEARLGPRDRHKSIRGSNDLPASTARWPTHGPPRRLPGLRLRLLHVRRERRQGPQGEPVCDLESSRMRTSFWAHTLHSHKTLRPRNTQQALPQPKSTLHGACV